MKILTPPRLNNSIWDVITQKCNLKYRFSSGMCLIVQEYPNFCNFTIGMIGNEMRHLLEWVKLYENFINNIETNHMLRENIATTSLKNSMEKTLYSKMLFCLFCILRSKSTAMCMARRSVHITTLFPGQA